MMISAEKTGSSKNKISRTKKSMPVTTEDIVTSIDNVRKSQTRTPNVSLKSFVKSTVDRLLLDIVVMVLESLNDCYFPVSMIRVFGRSSVKRARRWILLLKFQNA